MATEHEGITLENPFESNAAGIFRRIRLSYHVGLEYNNFSPTNELQFMAQSVVNTWSNVIIHISGDVKYHTAYKTYTPDALDVFTVNTHEMYAVDWGRTMPYERYVVSFDNDLFDDIFNKDRPVLDNIFAFMDHRKYPNLLKLSNPLKDELAQTLSASYPLLGADDPSVMLPALEIIVKLFTLFGRAVDEIKQSSEYKRASSLTKKVLQMVNDNFRDSMTLGDTAAMLYVNPQYLSRRFKLDTGISFNAYLLDRRLQHARHRLLLGGNVTETALESGFSNTSYFIKLYREKFGITPGKTQRDASPPGHGIVE